MGLEGDKILRRRYAVRGFSVANWSLSKRRSMRWGGPLLHEFVSRKPTLVRLIRRSFTRWES